MKFNRVEAMKGEIQDGNINFAMALADFHLMRGNITEEEFNELELLAYPPNEEVEE